MELLIGHRILSFDHLDLDVARYKDAELHDDPPTPHIPKDFAVRHGWKFKASKIRIGYLEVKILGVIISAHDKREDPTKVEALLSMKTPQNSPEVKSFVGLGLL